MKVKKNDSTTVGAVVMPEHSKRNITPDEKNPHIHEFVPSMTLHSLGDSHILEKCQCGVVRQRNVYQGDAR